MGSDWTKAASCRGIDPDLFFPVKEPGVDNRGEEAKRVCLSCPVRIECLDDAVRRNEKFGIWGGTGLDRRRALRRIFLSGDALAYQRALIEESAQIGRTLAGYEDDRVPTEERVCSRCPGLIPAGIHPVDRNGPGATCGIAATYNKGCRCGPCSEAKAGYLGGRSPRAGSGTVSE